MNRTCKLCSQKIPEKRLSRKKTVYCSDKCKCKDWKIRKKKEMTEIKSLSCNKQQANISRTLLKKRMMALARKQTKPPEPVNIDKRHFMQW